jgi:hypothetical protein
MVAIPIQSYRDVLFECFSEDEAFLNRWHIEAGKGINACVDTTLADLQLSNATFCIVHEESDLVGYFAKEVLPESTFLCAFFVRPKYRTKEFLQQFWQLVKSHFNSSFYVGLFDRNIPAIKFISKNNGEPVQCTEVHGHPGIIFLIQEHQ